jgi:long-chain acyl-CoA synthetase
MVQSSLIGAFEEACRCFPGRSAVRFLGTSTSYSELLSLVQRFARACAALGVKPGDRLLVYLPNCPQWLVAYLGAQYAEVVPVPVSPIYPPRELRYLVRNSGARVIVCADTNFGYAVEATVADAALPVIVTRMGDLLPAWKRWFGWLYDKLPTGSVPRRPNAHWLNRLLGRHSPAARARTDTDAHLAHILYTGGTTGFPKGVPHTHAEVMSGIAGMWERFKGHVGEGGESLIVPLPLYHMFTQDMVFGLGLLRGNEVVLLPEPRGDAVFASIEQQRGTLLIGVPSLYRRLLDNPRLDLYDLRSLRYCWTAGDVMPRETAARWERRTGRPLHQVYGSTETVVIAVSPLDVAPRAGSLGQVVATREVMLVDPATLTEAPVGEPGELLVASAHGAGGYWNNPEETARTYVTVAGRVWFRTGDIVRRSEMGELEFLDRSADLIKHKGYRVAASRVESVLHDHPAVIAAAVVGTPAAAAGENVKAFVILDPDARGVTAHDLVRHCRERLLPYEVPDYIEFRDMLPKSKVGKLLRRELRDEEARRAQTSQ